MYELNPPENSILLICASPAGFQSVAVKLSETPINAFPIDSAREPEPLGLKENLNASTVVCEKLKLVKNKIEINIRFIF